MGEPGRAWESPAEPKKSPREPGEPRRAWESLGEPGGVPGKTGSRGEPKRAWDSKTYQISTEGLQFRAKPMKIDERGCNFKQNL